MSGIYEQFGVTPGSNARGNQTLLGGAPPPPELPAATGQGATRGARRSGDAEGGPVTGSPG